MKLLSNKKCIHSKLNLLGYQVFRYISAKILSFIKRKKISNIDIVNLRKNGFLIKNDFLSSGQLEAFENYFINEPDVQLALDASFEDQDTKVLRKSIQMTELKGSAQLQNGMKCIYNYTSKVLNLPNHYRSEITLWFDKIIAKPGRCTQNEIHTDTYHNAYKVWYFPFGVESGQTPLVYYSGTHKFSLRRAFFEYYQSLKVTRGDELSWRLNDFHLCDLTTKGCMNKVICKPNTLVIVNVHGFHHRDIAYEEAERVQLHFSIPRIPSDGL